MPRHRVPGTGPKTKVGIAVDPELMKWVEARTGPGRDFASVSHAFEKGIRQLMMEEVLGDARRAVWVEKLAKAGISEDEYTRLANYREDPQALADRLGRRVKGSPERSRSSTSEK